MPNIPCIKFFIETYAKDVCALVRAQDEVYYYMCVYIQIKFSTHSFKPRHGQMTIAEIMKTTNVYLKHRCSVDIHNNRRKLQHMVCIQSLRPVFIIMLHVSQLK